MELPCESLGFKKRRKTAGVVICAINLSTEAAKTEDCAGSRASQRSLGSVKIPAAGLGFLLYLPLHKLHNHKPSRAELWECFATLEGGARKTKQLPHRN